MKGKYGGWTAASLLATALLLHPAIDIGAEAADSAGPAAVIKGADVAYVSNYISFVGSDKEGRVAFALDTNRGRDAGEYQAEHFVVLHDETRGWIDVAGDGDYENTDRILVEIPDSEDFRFSGTPAEGLTLTSPSNDFTLTIAPMPERLVEGGEGRHFTMGSAAATLEWGERTITGRVIHEGLAMAGANRLSGVSFGSGFGSFQGLYLRLGTGDDFYIHHQEGDGMEDVVAFAAFDGTTERPKNIEFEVTDRAFALGFFRWPTAWTVRFEGEKGPATLKAELHDRNLIVTWILGGFSMGIVEGTLEYDGRTIPVYGFGELIM